MGQLKVVITRERRDHVVEDVEELGSKTKPHAVLAGNGIMRYAFKFPRRSSIGVCSEYPTTVSSALTVWGLTCSLGNTLEARPGAWQASRR